VGEESQHPLEIGPDLGTVAAPEGPQQELVAHRDGRKEAPPLGDVGDPQVDDALRAQAGQGVPGEEDPPGAGHEEPADGGDEGALPGPVGAHQGDDLPRVDLQVDVPQHLHVAVARAEALDAQEGLSIRAKCKVQSAKFLVSYGLMSLPIYT
jgi:hypothetical protein